MTTNKIWLSMALALMILTIGCQKKDDNLIRYVNPLIGTGRSPVISGTPGEWGPKSWGQVIPAVSTPFGMTQWTPQTNDTESSCTAPYYYDGKRIQGFRGTHWLGGTCTSDYGSFTIMPITGYLRTFASDRASSFIHESETSTPAYYACMLEKYTTYAEMTGTARSGFFRFSYLSKNRATILVTPNSDEGKGYIKIDPEKQEIYGYNPVTRLNSGQGGFAGFNGYFVVRFNQPFSTFGCYFQMEDLQGQQEISNKPDIGVYAAFDIEANAVILVKAGTSFTSIEAARANLDAEIPHWDFQKTRVETEKVWNQTLSTIDIKGEKPEDYTAFYSAMYHSLLYPRTFSDADGSYPAFNGNECIQKVEQGHVYYDDFLLGSIHRAQLPLVSLVAPERYEDMMKSLVLKAEQGGWLPALPLRNCYNTDLSGDFAVTALGDAYLKDFDINIDKAYPYMLKNARASEADGSNPNRQVSPADSLNNRGNNLISDEDMKNLWLNNGKDLSFGEFVMRDFVLSKVAEKYGKEEDAVLLSLRSKELLKNNISLLQLLSLTQDVFVEVGQEGDKKQIHDKLDQLFNNNQYQHWNEQYHVLPYLYNFTGDYASTQKNVKNILARQYNNYDNGIPGNDKAGQTSAWYVFSALGFYPVSPGSGEYQLSSPLYKEVQLNFNQKFYPGKKLKIITSTNDTSQIFNSVKFFNKLHGFQIKHKDIKTGGKLVFSHKKN